MPASHRDGRGASLARRDEREYREYLTEEQRRQRGCIARRMQPGFHHGLLGSRLWAVGLINANVIPSSFLKVTEGGLTNGGWISHKRRPGRKPRAQCRIRANLNHVPPTRTEFLAASRITG